MMCMGLILALSIIVVYADTNAPCGKDNSGNPCPCIERPGPEYANCNITPIYSNGCYYGGTITCPGNTTTNQTQTCIEEGGSLGAVVPGNTVQCCPGLVAYSTPGIVGTRGTCISSTNNTQIECNLDSECMEVSCPLGGFVHYRCINNKCILNSKCPEPTSTCKVGCICNGETISCPTENQTITTRIGGTITSYVNSTITTPAETTSTTEIEIGKTSSGATSVTSGSVSVVTSENISVINSKLIMQTSTSAVQIKIMPNEAVSSSRIEKVDSIELNKEGEKPVYSISGTSSGKLILVIPVTAEIKTKVDAETGDIISTEKPWWSFLASGI